MDYTPSIHLDQSGFAHCTSNVLSFVHRTCYPARPIFQGGVDTGCMHTRKKNKNTFSGLEKFINYRYSQSQLVSTLDSALSPLIINGVPRATNRKVPEHAAILDLVKSPVQADRNLIKERNSTSRTQKEMTTATWITPAVTDFISGPCFGGQHIKPYGGHGQQAPRSRKYQNQQIRKRPRPRNSEINVKTTTTQIFSCVTPPSKTTFSTLGRATRAKGGGCE